MRFSIGVPLSTKAYRLRNRLTAITFYDIDSRQIQRELTERDRFLYLEEIRRDIAYYRRTYKRAHIVVDMAGWSPGEASLRIKDLLMRVLSTKSHCSP
jgi:hypothetical protein